MYWIELRKKEDVLSWAWDVLEVSFTLGRGGREFISG